MNISAIAAVAENGVIGSDNQLPWYLPADLAFFKRTTLGRTVIMGRKSFLSIGKALPKRTNIVVTRDPFFTADGILVAHSIQEAYELAYDAGETEVFIIGGADIYRQTMEDLDTLYVTEVATKTEGDAFFPAIQSDEWELVWSEARKSDDKNPFDVVFKKYERKRAEAIQ